MWKGTRATLVQEGECFTWTIISKWHQQKLGMWGLDLLWWRPLYLPELEKASQVWKSEKDTVFKTARGSNNATIYVWNKKEFSKINAISWKGWKSHCEMEHNKSINVHAGWRTVGRRRGECAKESRGGGGGEGFNSVTTQGVGEQVTHRSEVEQWRGGGGEERLLFQPSQLVDVTCLHTHKVSLVESSQNIDTCTTSRWAAITNASRSFYASFMLAVAPNLPSLGTIMFKQVKTALVFL